MAGKGDRPRPVDGERYRAGWERTFGYDIVVRANGPGEPRVETVGPLKGCYVAHIDAQPVRLSGDHHG